MMLIFSLHVMFVRGHAHFIVGDAYSFSALKRITIKVHINTESGF